MVSATPLAAHNRLKWQLISRQQLILMKNYLANSCSKLGVVQQGYALRPQAASTEQVGCGRGELTDDSSRGVAGVAVHLHLADAALASIRTTDHKVKPDGPVHVGRLCVHVDHHRAWEEGEVGCGVSAMLGAVRQHCSPAGWVGEGEGEGSAGPGRVTMAESILPPLSTARTMKKREPSLATSRCGLRPAAVWLL